MMSVKLLNFKEIKNRRKLLSGLKSLVLSFKSESGQLLTEVLVAMAVGGILMAAATVAIVSVIRQNFESRSGQTAASVGYDLLSKVKSYANSDWHNIYNLTHGATSTYYIVSSATSSIAVSSTESILANDISSGLVGHWKMDESSGSLAYDSSGNYNNGTLYSSPTRIASSSCQVGSCLSFNGGSYANIGSLNNLSGNNETISFWAKTVSQNDFGGFVDSSIGGSASTVRFYIGYYYSGSPYLAVFLGDGTNYNFLTLGNYSIPLDVWNHYGVTLSGNNVVLYINGSQYSSASTTITEASGIYKIANGFNGAGYLNGFVDDARVYDRALSANEISQLYTSSVYSRYFYVSNVSRDTDGNIVTSGGTDDPSTQKITVVTNRNDGGITQFNEYLTRTRDFVFTQSDWSGGSGQEGPITSPTNTFASSTGIVFSGSSLTCTAGASGNLTSSVIDTQSTLGAAINSLIWQGSAGGGSVSFQLAGSSTSTGPWSYVGPTGGGSYYSAGPNTSISVSNVNNYRYVRYMIYLTCPGGQTPPTVSAATLNWSP